MRTVKGVLVMLQDGGDKDEPRLMARQVGCRSKVLAWMSQP
jgi:hypothetical protein